MLAAAKNHDSVYFKIKILWFSFGFTDFGKCNHAILTSGIMLASNLLKALILIKVPLSILLHSDKQLQTK